MRQPAEARRRAAALADSYVAYRDQPRIPAADRPGRKPFQDVHVITPPSTPLAPDSHDVVLVVLVALVLGTALGGGTALLLDATSDRLRGPADVERLSGLPVLARVSSVAALPRSGVSTLHQMSGESDTYHRLRAGLTLGGTGRRVVLVTSGLRYDGVTVVAANIAVAVAESGTRALLVLADPEGPVFPATSVPGLAIADVAHADGAALRRGGDLARVIVSAGRDTVVIVAAPAMLTSAVALSVAELAHAVVLVADQRRSRRGELIRSLDLLAPARDRVHGVVLVEDRPAARFARWRRHLVAPLPGQRASADGSAVTAVSTSISSG
jgi:Mrp family chromosome partitioning ATPase